MPSFILRKTPSHHHWNECASQKFQIHNEQQKWKLGCAQILSRFKLSFCILTAQHLLSSSSSSSSYHHPLTIITITITIIITVIIINICLTGLALLLSPSSPKFPPYYSLDVNRNTCQGSVFKRAEVISQEMSWCQ